MKTNKKIYVTPVVDKYFFADLCEGPEDLPSISTTSGADSGWTAPARNASKLYI